MRDVRLVILPKSKIFHLLGRRLFLEGVNPLLDEMERNRVTGPNLVVFVQKFSRRRV